MLMQEEQREEEINEEEVNEEDEAYIEQRIATLIAKK